MAEYRINMTPSYKAEQLAISQNDVGRELTIYLVGANREAYIIPDGAQITLVGTKPSGLGFTVAGIYSGSTVTFTTTAEMSDEAGRIPCEVRITSGNKVIGSSNADLYVELNPHPDGTTDGTAEHVVSVITALVERAETAATGAGASATAAAEAARAAQDALNEFTDISVAINTLPAGSQATASYNDGLLTLGIPRGDRGAQGERGETGATGATGAQGVGISNIAFNSDYTLTITLTDGSIYTTGSIRGAQGVQGVQGEQGERGETGAAGAAATIAVGTVTSGTTAAVTNRGTSAAAILDFTMPVYQLTTADKTEITNAVLAQFEDAETTGM